MSKEKLNILDDDGHIIGEELRSVIHKKGLLHREIHVWLFTPDKRILFQHRAKNKDTAPDMLDATCGGHVDIGEDWLEAAVRELQEECGLSVRGDKLKFMREFRNGGAYDPVTGTINNALRYVYAVEYTGKIDDLVPEEGKSQGFVAWELEDLKQLSEEESLKFIPSLIDEASLSMYSLFWD